MFVIRRKSTVLSLDIDTFLKLEPAGEEPAFKVVIEKTAADQGKYDYFIKTVCSDYWMKSSGKMLVEERDRFDGTHPKQHWNLDVVQTTEGKYRGENDSAHKM